MVKESFGEYLRNLREDEDIPIRKVAAALDIDQSTLSKFERGERLPKEEIIPKIAKYFEVDFEEMRLSYFGDKVVKQILFDQNAERILETAKEKLEYIKSKNYNQGKLNFNGI
ncbi:helix-turn-helix transcriptional regulator [Fulvivirga sp. M361]|uniref:helix-turn-helix domain-containing protein n=1 Tax=Fulvivirga sp. M361 TaxID=2594266 RepID=UPI00117A68D5|nr:helix-turn-helix transcriptional regulator [Fulvivirga sp. M361]TRX49647.1 helix-turn-helix transcriptional regulator [Fulvivirga sp. M361]